MLMESSARLFIIGWTVADGVCSNEDTCTVLDAYIAL